MKRSSAAAWISIYLLVLPLGAQQPQMTPAQQVPPSRIPPYMMQPNPAAVPLPAPAQPAPKPAAVPAKPQSTPPTATPVATPTSAPPNPTPAATAPAVDPGFQNISLQNASLIEVIDQLARRLHINYILDPRVKGGVILNTYGETKNIDTRSLLDTILRINGFTMVQVGDIFRIVPLADAPALPLSPQVNSSSSEIPVNDQIMLNLVFLKFASAEDVQKIITPFVGEGAKSWVYGPANLLFILDSSRSMRRTMELISLFDNDNFAGQRIRNFEVKNSRPSDLAHELDTIFKSISLNERATPLKFLPLDRINTIIGIAANPAAFQQVQKWIDKLDVEVQRPAGAVDNYVYRVRYGQAQCIAMAIMSLYTGSQFGGAGMGMGACQPGGASSGAGVGYGNGGGGYGGGNYGGGGGGLYGSGGLYNGLANATAYPGGVNPQPSLGPLPGQTPAPGTVPASTGAFGGTQGVTPDQTGMVLGPTTYSGYARIPKVVPNPLDNSLLIQATPSEYTSIVHLLRELDIPPRQVLIDAKIYEVTLSGAFSSGVQAYLSQRGTGANGTSLSQVVPAVAALSPSGAAALSVGTLVGKSRELLAFLNTQSNASRTKILSAPSVIATDSIPATIVVGEEVPTLSGSLTTGAGTGGPAVATAVQSRNVGVTLNITARINPSGIVTLIINQEVSADLGTSSGGIDSPSFSKRSIQTQVTVEDGDTIAVGGIIQENSSRTSSGLPGLHNLPVVGALFGNRGYSKDRTELIVFFTPRVIYDTNQMVEASDELRGRLKKLNNVIKD